MNKKALPGFFDILPNSQEEWRESHRWNYVEEIMTETAYEYGFHEKYAPHTRNSRPF